MNTQRDESNDQLLKDQNKQNYNRLETRWDNIRGSYRRRYPSLTEDDLRYRSGEFHHMTDRIAKRTNRHRDQVLNEIRDWDYEE